ncbi:TIGR02453 family protein [Zhouia amylolytica]|uniref:TIGR02453 family protein n=1 Tax=Zhouia amylolytica TaxID=376730 RepID=A0A1I6UPH8_9FLAO|nr:DUF2461 domain-containing protein [Zhouia amylolytica]MCQ0110723.1 DUF2461 domain-containing protein [Zhouia amylolytica]SFT03341.1 TIGR02453 family protein [Zhouia amylolytica]
MQLQKEVFEALRELKANNNRDWFETHKKEFKKEEKNAKNFFEVLLDLLKTHDEVDKMKMFRIYRDVRFSKDKTPYKTHFSASFHRVKPRLRGGYYLQIEPGNSFLACGFWAPEKADLLRIRKEFELDDSEIRALINSKDFKDTFGMLKGDELKTAPKGFDKDHPAIDLIRKKQFIVIKEFNDKEVLSQGFMNEVNEVFKKIRPYFDYMSEILTTDLNGVSLID